MSFRKTLHAFYDFRVAPVSFDVLTFLVEAERLRLDKGLEHIHVLIVLPSNLRRHQDIKLFDAEHAGWRLNNVMLPSCRLLPSVQNVTVCGVGDLVEWILRRAKENVFPEGYTLEDPLPAVHTGLTVIAANLGKPCQFIEASPQARQYARQWLDARANGRKCVPITLRESPYNPQRNSDLTVWGQIAQHLKAAGHFPFILRDIDKALDDHPPEFEEISFCPEGVFNLELRMALYEESHICAFVANGPAWACSLNRNVQYLYFVTGDWVDTNPPGMYKLGIGVGRTPPHANHFQKWIWDRQDANIFMDEFVAMDNHIEQSRVDGSYESKLDPVVENREPMEVLAKRFSCFPNSYLNIDHHLMFQCISLCPSDVIENPDTQLMLGEFYLQRQEWETSQSHYLKAVAAIDAPEPWPLAQLGMICELQSYDDEAMEYYGRALTIDKRLSPVHYRMGALAQKKGDMINASEHFQLSIESGETDQQVFAKLDELLERIKQLDKLDQPELASRCSGSAINLWRLSIRDAVRESNFGE